MIWYDFVTREPVAPGACEDGGAPSIKSYYCYECKKDVDLIYKLTDIICARCRLSLLTRL